MTTREKTANIAAVTVGALTFIVSLPVALFVWTASALSDNQSRSAVCQRPGSFLTATAQTVGAFAVLVGTQTRQRLIGNPSLI